MATLTKANRQQQQAADQQLIDGITKHASSLSSLTFAGASHTPAAILAVLQARIAAADGVLPARAAWQSKVKAARDERAQTNAFVSGLRQALQLAFAGGIDALADFGLRPRKPRAPLTPAQKAAAVAKGKATRAARHTMGTKQKSLIKGTVPQTAPTTPTPTAPSASVPTAPPTAAKS